MKNVNVNQKIAVSILAMVLVFGVQGISSGQTLSASSAQPLIEATLNITEVTLTLHGLTYTNNSWEVERNLKVLGIAGVTIDNVSRRSDTEVRVRLAFTGNINATSTLTFTLEAGGIENYEGPPLTAELPVSASEESVVASSDKPLTETTLSGSSVTLTLHGRTYLGSFAGSFSKILNNVKVSGIDGVTVWGGNHTDTEVALKLNFNGTDFDGAGNTLTFTVEAGAIENYEGPALTAELPVSASDESVRVSTARPLTEATLDGNIVTLVLQDRTYRSDYIGDSLKVSGISGITWSPRYRSSATEVEGKLSFDGRDFDRDTTLTFTVEARAIENYKGPALTVELPVSASNESVRASAARPLTEATLDGNIVTLTLHGGRIYAQNVRSYMKVSGIAGVTVSSSNVRRVSDTVVTIRLDFNGNINTAATLTFTVNAGAIANYQGSALTAELPVSASDESVRASAASPLTEATLNGSIVTLTLHGRVYETSRDISRYLKISGIAGVTFTPHNVNRVSDTEATVELNFDDRDFDGPGNKLTFTVEAGAIAGYNGPTLMAELPVSASDESVRASAANPLTEATLDGNTVTLTLHGGRTYERRTVASHLKVSGIVGATFRAHNVQRVSDTEVTVKLGFDGTDFDGTENKFTFTVNAGAIANYKGDALTAELPVSASDESVAASTTSPLTEATLDGNIVTLTLHGGRIYAHNVRSHVKVSGIAGVTVSSSNVKRVSDTVVTVELGFNGNINTAATLTFTVEAGAIENYKGAALTAELPVFGGDEYVIASVASSLTEATLNRNVVTLTLHGGRVYETPRDIIARHVKVSGIAGVTQPNSSNVQRVSDTEVTVRLDFDGTDFDGTGNKLTFTVAAGAIENYEGSALTAELPVSASDESVRASAARPLTEATLDGNIVTLTLHGGRIYVHNVRSHVKVSGIAGVTVSSSNVKRVSDTAVTVELDFNGNINTASTLTFTVYEGAIENYKGPALTAELPVFGGDEYVVASTTSPLTEATLNGSIVTLTLRGRTFSDSIGGSLSVSGISGVSLNSSKVKRVSDTEITVPLNFDGSDFDRNATLTFRVSSGAIENYNGSALTAELPVTATVETLPPVEVGEPETDTPDLAETQPTGSPDLVVSDIRVSKATLVPGENFTLYATVENNDTGQAAAATLRYYRATDNVNWSDATEVDTNRISALSGNREVEVSLALTAPTREDAYYYYACIDRVSNERDPNNNCSMWISVTVAASVTTNDVGTTHPRPSIYWVAWSASTTIQRAGLDGSNVTDVLTELDFPSGIAVDIERGKIYWTESGEWDALGNPIRATGKIQCADLDGSNVTALVTGLDDPRGIALDVAGGKMYWTVPGEVNRATQTFTGKIQCADLDGSNVTDLITGLEPPRGGIALDVSGGKIYWTDWDKIQCADLDGSNVTALVTGLYNLSDIALDVAGGKMYWMELLNVEIHHDESGGPIGIIQCADLEGSNVTDLVTGLSNLGGIAVDELGGKIYWTSEKYNAQTNSFTGKIQCADLDGSNVTDFLTGVYYPSSIALGIPIQNTELATVYRAEDVNQDGKVDTADLGMVAAALFSRNPPAPLGRLDVNGDGELTIDDLLQISNNLDEDDAAAAPALGVQRNTLDLDKIQAAIDLLLASDDSSLGVRRTLVYLQNLLAAVRPDETQLFANYPNPFNPETWLPYQLSTDNDVQFTIYDASGRVVRQLALGYQSAGYYTSRSRAAYWDGRNAQGERVASGLYFYTLTTGNFSATRRMLILK